MRRTQVKGCVSSSCAWSMGLETISWSWSRSRSVWQGGLRKARHKTWLTAYYLLFNQTFSSSSHIKLDCAPCIPRARLGHLEGTSHTHRLYSIGRLGSTHIFSATSWCYFTGLYDSKLLHFLILFGIRLREIHNIGKHLSLILGTVQFELDFFRSRTVNERLLSARSFIFKLWEEVGIAMTRAQYSTFLCQS